MWKGSQNISFPRAAEPASLARRSRAPRRRADGGTAPRTPGSLVGLLWIRPAKQSALEGAKSPAFAGVSGSAPLPTHNATHICPLPQGTQPTRAGVESLQTTREAVAAAHTTHQAAPATGLPARAPQLAQ